MLTDRGVPLGTLCVIDRCPRTLGEDQKQAMHALARQVMIQLDLRRNKMRLESVIREKQAALDELHALQGVIPICCYCKRIRDDKAFWHQLENYLSTYGKMRFSHGICPECYPEVIKDLPKPE